MNRKQQLLKLIYAKCCNLTTQNLQKVRDYINELDEEKKTHHKINEN